MPPTPPLQVVQHQIIKIFPPHAIKRKAKELDPGKSLSPIYPIFLSTGSSRSNGHSFAGPVMVTAIVGPAGIDGATADVHP